MLSVDVFRGLVMLLLLPDITGGFSFHVMHRQFPDDPVWAALASAFTHVQWTGASIWDLIMPSFVFLVGVAMPLSAAARQTRGDSWGEIFGHVCLRSAALFLLGLLLTMPLLTHGHELWPLLLLAVGLPIPRYVSDWLGVRGARAPRYLEMAWWIAILTASAVWIYTHLHERGNYDLAHVFNSLALASVPAFLLMGRPRRAQLSGAIAILVGYWLLFALYPVPGAGFDASRLGVRPDDEVFHGFFAHWNKNTNIAAAFDVWLLNLLPRPRPFLFQGNGVQTLQFIPIISTIVFGIMAGELLRSDRPRREIRTTLLLSGAAATAAGLLVGVALCPIVKSIWTPSWGLLSTGVTLLVLGVLYHLYDVRDSSVPALPFVVIGTNCVLLYTLASCYRWRFLQIPRRLFGASLFGLPPAPVLESLVFGAIMWLLAFALYRAKVFVRI